jgi:hypothetical protein
MGSADQWDDVSCYICATANDNGEPIFCCAASIVQRQGVAANADRSDDMRTPDLSGAHVDIVRFRVFRVVGVEIDRRAVQAR